MIPMLTDLCVAIFTLPGGHFLSMDCLLYSDLFGLLQHPPKIVDQPFADR